MKNSSPNPRSPESSAADLIRFDRFMAEALYGPRGYYTSPRVIIGARGDFTTTPKLTKVLAQRIAEWIRQTWKHYGEALPVIELGPGDGTLARDIRRSLGFTRVRKLDYHFVEISPHLTTRQQEGNKGTWHRTLREALRETKGRALIISNEFFDAFPVRIFNSALEELFLDPDGREVWRPGSELPDSILFDALPMRFEVAESIRAWFQSDLATLEKGDVLSIDYGGDATENYHRRPLGTLRAYAHHMRLLPPEAYRNPGRQDLTFDVLFPDIVRWGEEIGVRKISQLTQVQFLQTGDEDGAGGAFKVLHQRAGG